MQKKHFLHELLRNTNIERPTPNLISYYEFPEQDQNLINEKLMIKYIDEKYVPQYFETNHKDLDDHVDRAFEEEFTRIRADVFDQYNDAKHIYLSTDGEKIIVIQKDKNTTYFVTPEVHTHLIGLRVYPEYDNDLEREAYLFSIQGLENGFATIIEYLNEYTYRIILDTEMYFTYDPDDVYIPVEEPDLGSIRNKLIEGRTAFYE